MAEGDDENEHRLLGDPMKVRIIIGTVALLCASAWCLNKNQSVEFAQDLNRNASTDADAAFHNPAGLAFLPADGLYLGGGNQIILEDRSIQEHSPLIQAYGSSEYDGKIHVWAFPTVQAAYHKSDLTFFVHGGPLGGGGKGEFDQGLPQFDNMILGFISQTGAAVKSAVDKGYQQALGDTSVHVTNGSVQQIAYKRDLSFTGDEFTYGGTFGGAYRILPTLSASAAYRFSYARNAYKGTAKVSQHAVAYVGSTGLPAAGITGPAIDDTLKAHVNYVLDSLWRNVDVDVVSTGMAHSIVLGLDFKPDEIWNIGLRFEWNGDLILENNTSSLVAPDSLVRFLSAYADGAKTNITEPMVLAGGVSWKGVQNLTLESSWTYGFYENVDRDGAEAHYRNSIFGGLGARYKVTPTVETSLGYAYDWAYKEDVARSETDFDMPTHFLSAGLSYQATPRLKIDGGVMVGISPDQHGISAASGASQTMSQGLWDFGLGVEWTPEL
jgi:long-chain fatty acid transport protein